MRKYTLSAPRVVGALLAILCLPMSGSVMAQDEGSAPAEAPEPRDGPTAKPPQLTPDQQVTLDAWSPKQQASYAAWPADVQSYYWTLPRPRQDSFWRLTDNDKVALTRMEPVDQAEAWTLVERRLRDGKADGPAETPDKPDGS